MGNTCFTAKCHRRKFIRKCQERPNNTNMTENVRTNTEETTLSRKEIPSFPTNRTLPFEQTARDIVQDEKVNNMQVQHRDNFLGKEENLQSNSMESKSRISGS